MHRGPPRLLPSSLPGTWMTSTPAASSRVMILGGQPGDEGLREILGPQGAEPVLT
jgi:hypothetical protein